MDILAIVKLILNDRLDLIEGCQQLSRLRFELSEEENPLFFPFRTVDSEADAWPPVNARKHCHSDYLKRIDQERKEYIERIRPEIIRACRDLIDGLNLS